MLRYEFTEPFFTNKPHSGKSCQDHIRSKSATWYLSQLRNDLSLAVGVAEGCITETIHDGTLPASLVVLPPERPPIKECKLFILTLRLFGQYTTKFRKESEEIENKEDSINQLKLSLCAVVDTKVKVVGREVMMFSDDVELMEFVRDKVQEAGYLFRTIMVEEEAQKWWEPITKEQ